MSALLDVLVQLAPGLASVARSFELMEIAGQELKRARSPDALFMALVPPEGMHEAVDDVYRAHCRELVLRANAGADLRPATRAEMLLVFSRMSLEAPLNDRACAAYHSLARDVLGMAVIEGLAGREPHAPYEGAVEEIISEMQRRFSVPGRALRLQRDLTAFA